MKVMLRAGGALHYEVGLASGLAGQGIDLELIGGDELLKFDVVHQPHIIFRNLHGKQDPKAPAWRKLLRVVLVYWSLIIAATKTQARLVHIQWPYKLVFLDRTLLNLYYKLLRKKLVYTAHNIDGDARDGTSSWSKRFSLRFQYRVANHIIVHTAKMKAQLMRDFNVADGKISVIPHGVMTAVPETTLSEKQAREKLGLKPSEKVLLFFGLITPYKGVETLVEAVGRLRSEGKVFRLVIAGRVKECAKYWEQVENTIARWNLGNQIILDLRYVPDEEAEVYLKAADALVLPYRDIFQSGALFLAYRFGLPVVATDVGSFKEELQEAQAGFVCRPNDPADLARVIEHYFGSGLYGNLANSRRAIRGYAAAHFSWDNIAAETVKVYEQVLCCRAGATGAAQTKGALASQN